MAGNHQRLGSAGVHLTTAGPLSLLLLPKCPLCFLPILAALGITLPVSATMPVVVGVLIAVWTAVLLLLMRRQPRLRAGACIAALVSLVAVAMGNRVLLWTGVAGMMAAGLASGRTRRRDAAQVTTRCPLALCADQPCGIKQADCMPHSSTILRHVDIPITPPKVWQILQEKGVAE
jgi:hypothetical protein